MQFFDGLSLYKTNKRDPVLLLLTFVVPLCYCLSCRVKRQVCDPTIDTFANKKEIILLGVVTPSLPLHARFCSILINHSLMRV